MPPSIRPARIEERDVLDDICFRAKAHWGYDATFMESVRDQIRVSAEAIALGHVWVGVDASGKPGAVMQIDRLSRHAADLSLMFVAPEAMRGGFGRALFDKARALARAMGVAELLIDSDPQAAGFYAAMGCKRVGAEPTGYQGRLLPRFSYPLRKVP